MSVPKPRIVFGRVALVGTEQPGREYRVLKVRSWSGYMPGDYVSRAHIEELLDSQQVRMGKLEVEVLGDREDLPYEVRR